ncbi:hypothetical protein ACFL0W_00880 [Nanoarchaeota archaeon]
MPRGRPVKSQIRQNVIEILAVVGKAYGYEIFKIYKQIFPKVTLRSIYYHLQKGIDLGEIKADEVKIEQGNFSWGGTVEKKYYALGPSAQPQGDPQVKAFVEKQKS